MGGRLWKDYEDRNIDFPTLYYHYSQEVDGSHLCVCAIQRIEFYLFTSTEHSTKCIYALKINRLK